VPLSAVIVEVVRYSDEAEAIPSQICHGLKNVAIAVQVFCSREEPQMLLGRRLTARNLEPSKLAADKRASSDPAMMVML